MASNGRDGGDQSLIPGQAIAGNPAPWHRGGLVLAWLAVAPLATCADSLFAGLALAGSLLLCVAATHLLAAPAASRLAPASRLLAAQLLAATVVTLLGLLAQAFAFAAFRSAGAWLALVVASGALAPGWAGPGGRARWQPGIGVALLLAACGALREFGGPLLATIADCHILASPATAFFVMAGAIAAAGHRGPRAPAG